MALPLSKLVVSRNAPVLKCMKGRNIAFWTKKVPVFKTVSCNVTSRDFSTQRLKPIFSWPRMVAKEIRCEKLKKPCLSLQRSASCSTLSTKTPTENTSVLQRSKSQVDLHVTRGCKKRPDQEYQEQMPMPMGPCNCPWPGGCPPPGFMQSGNPCAMGMGGCCAPPMPGSPGCMGNMGNMGNMQNMPNMQCPCCGAQAPGACTPFGACGACAVPPGMMSGNMGQGMPGMPGMPPGMQCTMPGCMAGGCPGMPQGGMPGGMQGMPGGMQGGMCGSWGPCGGPMCAQGVPCPFPCPCHSANEQQAENKSNKKDGQ